MKFIFVFTLAISLLEHYGCAVEANCDSEGYTRYNETGHCYKFHRTPVTWHDGLTTCRKEGGWLAIINSFEEARVIRRLFAKNPADTIPVVDPVNHADFANVAFIGVRKVGKHWRTLDDQTLSEAGYDVFHAGEPNNATGDEFCISVARNAQLKDEPCGRYLAFICERGPNTVSNLNHKPMS